LKQYETKDQTGKGAKIKGSNYNLSGGLITKLQNTSKDQIRNMHFELANGVVSLTTVDHLFHPQQFRQ